jgi:phenylphosphate carboxylase alpha subunit
MPFPYEDLREEIAAWEEAGELVRIQSTVDWDLEVGAITRRGCELGQGRAVRDGGQPALLFENIKGYPKGYRILGNSVGSFKRAAIVAGHPNPDNPVRELRSDLQDIYLRGLEHPVKPVIVDQAPCKENKAFGDECDLLKFPSPIIHEGDGGRYICSWHLVATMDKLSSWMNWGMYRIMVLDQKTLVGSMSPASHGATMYHTQYEPANEPMPFAIAIGTDSLSMLAACNPIPHGISEVDVVGGWRQQPLRVIKCETNDLLVPASAEIVIEGVIPPNKRASEGPFAEYTGYGGGVSVPRPVYEVSCITWRDDPILVMSNMGMPVHDGNVFPAMGYEGAIKKALHDAGIQVSGVNLAPEYASCLVVISAKVTGPRMANRIMAIVNTIPMAKWIYKFIICDEDVDVFNLDEVLHAWITKCHPERDTWVNYQPGNPLCPYVDHNERQKMTAPSVMYDCTTPFDWSPEDVPTRASFEKIYPRSIQDKVLKNWASYGLK